MLARIFKGTLILPVFWFFNKVCPKTAKAIKLYGGNAINKNELLKYKKSDTLFILGSGQSINNFSQTEWELISKHDSIGINDFIRVGFVPTFHSMETEKQDDKIFLNRWEKSFTCIKNYVKQNLNTIFIIRPNTKNSSFINEVLNEMSSKKLLFWNNYHPLPGLNRRELNYFINLYKNLGLINNNWFFLNRGSSLSWIISFAYKLKYRKIILCGIDLHGKHFFDTNLKLEKEDINFLHFTADSSKNTITVVDILLCWNNLMKDDEIQLFVSTKYSLLAKYFPIYFKNI